MRFIRSALVGGMATLVDFLVLEVCVRLVMMEPTRAKIPALALGALAQFVGSRTFAFKAQRGNVARQASMFMIAEVATLAMNWLVFRLLVRYFRVPFEIANFVGTFVVFVGFSYPIWRMVFRVPEEETAPEPAALDGAAAAAPQAPDFDRAA